MAHADPARTAPVQPEPPHTAQSRYDAVDLTCTSGSSPGDPAGLHRSVETLCVQAGRGRRDGEPLFPPLVQSTSFARDGVDSTSEHAYSRVSNPTVAVLEEALGDLEEAPPAVAFASGLAAEAAALQALSRAGDHVVASRAQYGGTTRLLERVLARQGLSVTFVDSRDVEAVEAALRPETRLVWIETPANPTLDLTDLTAVSRVARGHGARLVVDNTFLTGVLQRPLDLGADAVVTSTTKLVEGHSVALGGAVTSRDEELVEELRFVRKCTGGILPPFHAWLTLLGLKTLPLRIARQSESAERLARALAERSDIKRVYHPALDSPELAARQHRGAHGNVLAFELEGGYGRATRALRHVRLCALAEHVGSVETLLTHSASMTHAGVAPEARRAAGISDGLLRLSVGLEDPADVLADLGRAFDLSAKEVTPCKSA